MQKHSDHGLEGALHQARRRGAQLDHAVLPIPADLDQAIAVQDRVIALSDEKVVGWKIAGSPEGSAPRQVLGEPVHGPLLQSAIYRAPVALSFSRFVAPKVEGEIGLRLARNLEPGKAIDPESPIEEWIDAAFLGCDLADDRYRDPKAAGFFATVADLGGMGAYIVGPEIPLGLCVPEVATGFAIEINGAVVSEGFTHQGQHDPRAILYWLSRRLAARGRGLAQGDIVTTGTMSPPVKLAGPCKVRILGATTELSFEILG